MNYLLLSGIFSALNCLEDNEQWDLSIGEQAKLVRSFYDSLKDGLPKTKDEWITIFDKAHIACWGVDHTCDKVTDNELWLFITSMADCYDIEKEVYSIDYCKQLGIKYTPKKDEYRELREEVEDVIGSNMSFDEEKNKDELRKILNTLRGIK